MSVLFESIPSSLVRLFCIARAPLCVCRRLRLSEREWRKNREMYEDRNELQYQNDLINLFLLEHISVQTPRTFPLG